MHELVFSKASKPIFMDGLSRNLADLFDFGGWLVNPSRAADSGLVYDACAKDYLHFPCASGYDHASIKNIATRMEYECPSPLMSMLDLNLPSITILFHKEDVTVIRTVTNVGAVNSVYKVNVIRQATQLQFHGIHRSQSQFHLLIWELDLDRHFSQGHHLNLLGLNCLCISTIEFGISSTKSFV